MSYVQKLLSKKVTAGKAQVLFLIAVNRNVRFRYKTPCFVEPELWNEKTNNLRVINKATKLPPKMMKSLREYKLQLDDLERKIEFLIAEYPEQVSMKIVPPHAEEGAKEEYWMSVVLDNIKDKASADLTKDIIENIFRKEQDTEALAPESSDFFGLTKLFLEKRDICSGRRNSYNVIFRSMARYEIFRNKIAGTTWHWSIDKTDSNDMTDFFDYFKNEKSYREQYGKIFDETLALYPIECTCKHKNPQLKDRGGNYMACSQKKVKAFWNWLIKNRMTTNNPFIGVEMIQETYGIPYYISIAERNKLLQLDLSDNPSKATQRDIFVFQCLVGCRVGDLMKLTKKNVVNDILIYSPGKSKKSKVPIIVRVPLCQMALDFIAKYDGLDPKGRLLPFISRSDYNTYIKEILEECEITRMVDVRDPVTGEDKMCRICDVASSHMARRTFVGNAYKQVKDPNLIGKMSGHVEGSKAFARYRDIDDDMLRDVINMIQ